MISRKHVTQVYCTLSCIPLHDHNESYNQGKQRRPCNCTADPAPGVPAGAPHTSEGAFFTQTWLAGTCCHGSVLGFPLEADLLI